MTPSLSRRDVAAAMALAELVDYRDGDSEREIKAEIARKNADALIAELDRTEPPAEKPNRPRIVCLCGSTRFMDAFQEHNERLTLGGCIVLSVGCNVKGERVYTDQEKDRLDELHKRKIDLADEVLVLNVGGYIGPSTRSEIEYAMGHGKPVSYIEQPVADQPVETPKPEAKDLGTVWLRQGGGPTRVYDHQEDAGPGAILVRLVPVEE